MENIVHVFHVAEGKKSRYHSYIQKRMKDHFQRSRFWITFELPQETRNQRGTGRPPNRSREEKEPRRTRAISSRDAESGGNPYLPRERGREREREREGEREERRDLPLLRRLDLRILPCDFRKGVEGDDW